MRDVRVMMRIACTALLSAATAVHPTGFAPGPLHHYEAARLSMACVYAIEAYGPDANLVAAAVNDAFDEVDRIDRLMSHYKPDSPLSRLNREAASQAVVVDQELFDFIADAMRYTRQSDGAFDITVGPLMKTWGFFGGEGHMPSDADLDEARRHVGATHVTLNAAARTIRFDQPGVELDLGGIAKGYAVDRAVGLLRARGVAAALISAGGSTIYGLGAPPDSGAWEVAIQDPVDARRTARTVRLKNRALSVAGSSEKAFEVDGVRYSHIMDPRTGRPVQGVLSVAVLAPSGTMGDALDDALFVLGPSRHRTRDSAWPGVEAMFFLPERDHSWTMVHER
jgi:thiamine biosynthesis lipoprotein